MRYLREDEVFRRFYRLTWRGPVLEHVEAKDAGNAVRIYRRTMQPFKVLTHKSGKQYEAVCYPYVHDGVPMIMVREEIGEPSTLKELCCDELRPIQFAPLVTGIPANDPMGRAS